MLDWRAEVQARAGNDVAADVAEEMAQHLEAHYEELRAEGMTAAAARTATLAELNGGRWDELWRGARERMEEELPRRGWAGVGRDLRYALRRLRRSPGFAVAAILSLALGIGANAAIFQLLDAVALQTLPVKDPGRLAEVQVVARSRTGDSVGYPAQLTYALWQQVAAQQKGFSDLGAWYADNAHAGEGAGRRNVRALLVSGGFFSTLGVGAARGRLLGPQDDPAGCRGFHLAGVVLSYAFWQSEYGGTPVLGRTLAVEGRALPILGVSAAGFTGLNVGRSFDVALPLCAEPLVDGPPPLLTNAEGWWLAAVGRLKPDWTRQQASAQLAAIGPAIFAATLPAMYSARDRATYLQDKLAATPAATGVSQLRRQYEEPLWLLMALAGVVLLIACANLANLMLARAGTRRREMAVRLALGASRARLVRQLLAESVLLAIAGALTGAALGWGASRALTAFMSTADARVVLHIALDWRVVALLAGLAMAACILFGLAPALKASGAAPAEALGASGRGLAAGGRSPLRRGLMIAQVALALLLLVSALLFAGTLGNLLGVDPGFDATGVTVGYPDYSQVASARLAQEQRAMLAAMRQLPGVRAAASASILPLSGMGWNNWVAIDGAAKHQHVVDLNAVSPGYFGTLGIPLVAGRDFTTADAKTAPGVAIVNRAFARKYLQGASPIGHTLQIAGGRGVLGPPFTIVGVVGDTKYFTLREPFVPIIYQCVAQDAAGGPPGLVLRSLLPPGAVAAAARTAAEKIDPSISLTLQGLGAGIREGLLRERLMSVLAECFAGLAVLLALIGLYGVIAYMAVQRRREMGIRLALGAPAGSVVGLILREAWLLLAIGLAAGLGLALVAGRAARALLFGVTASDPRTLAAAVATLAIAGTLAALVPARRAAAADPVRTLREE
ncbi:MAG: ABC transporter permease [Acidobacteria bacterium]|nr:MAG: ABC transporter permease [Acidobacteriota bacterium]